MSQGSGDQKHSSEHHYSDNEDDYPDEDQAGKPQYPVFTGNQSSAAAPLNAAGDPSGMPSANPSNFGNPMPPAVGLGFASTHNYNKPSLFGSPSAIPIISGQTAIFGGVPAPQSPTYSSQSHTFHPINSFNQAPKTPSIFSNAFTSSAPTFLNPVMPPPINNNTTNTINSTNNKKHHYISPNSKVTNNNHVVQSISLNPNNINSSRLTILQLRICHQRGITPQQYVAQFQNKEKILQEDLTQLKDIVGDHFQQGIALAKAKSVQTSQSNLFNNSTGFTGNLFGGMFNNLPNPNNPHKVAGLAGSPTYEQTVAMGLFGNNNNKNTTTSTPPQTFGLFGSNNTPASTNSNTNNFSAGLFGSNSSTTATISSNSGNNFSGGLFGTNFNQPVQTTNINLGLFTSNTNSVPLNDSTQAAMSSQSSLFNNNNSSPGLFAIKPTLNLFGPPTPTSTPTSTPTPQQSSQPQLQLQPQSQSQPETPQQSVLNNNLFGCFVGVGPVQTKVDKKHAYKSKCSKLDSKHLIKSICHGPFNVNNLTKTELRICSILGISTLQYPPASQAQPPVSDPTALAKALQAFKPSPQPQPQQSTQPSTSTPSFSNNLFNNNNNANNVSRSVFATSPLFAQPQNPVFPSPSPSSSNNSNPTNLFTQVNNSSINPTSNMNLLNSKHLYKSKNTRLDCKHRVNCISAAQTNVHNLSKNQLRFCHIQGLTPAQYVANQASNKIVPKSLPQALGKVQKQQQVQKPKTNLFNFSPPPFLQSTPAPLSTSTSTSISNTNGGLFNKPLLNLFSSQSASSLQKPGQTRTQSFFSVFQSNPIITKPKLEPEAQKQQKSINKEQQVKRVIQAVLQTDVIKKINENKDKIDLGELLQQTMQIMNKPKEQEKNQ